MKVFISHNHRDKEVAELLATFVKNNEMGVWFDEWELSAGDSLPGKIAEGVAECSHFVLIWSSHAATSNWVTQELESALYRAVETGSPKLIPVVLDETDLPGLMASRVYRRVTESERNQSLWNLALEIAGKGPSDDWLKDFVRAYHVIYKVYEAEIYGASEHEHPFGMSACPDCGSRNLEASGGMGPRGKFVFARTSCPDCGFTEHGEV